METMFRPEDRMCQLRGAEAVCPDPIGSGQSIDALALTLSGRNDSLGTIRNALSTLADRRIPLFTSF